MGSLNGLPALARVHANVFNARTRIEKDKMLIEKYKKYDTTVRQLQREIDYLKEAVSENPTVKLYLYDPDPSAQPKDSVGLLFMCAVAGLRQFSIQQGGSDDDSFPFVGPPPAFSGLESVIGQAAPGAEVRPQPWPFRDANDPKAVRHSASSSVSSPTDAAARSLRKRMVCCGNTAGFTGSANSGPRAA